MDFGSGIRVARVALLVACVLSFAAGAGQSGEAPQPRANRLIDSGSPYLLLHARNPVDWYPWGEEALAKARRENKPIFVSFGYSTCYWCHVANRTLYSDPEIAALMNRWFVNIKVDREQRPELDAIYMLATQLLTGRGGWPNNVFLTPDLKPFFGGSYFPPADDDFGRPGFATVLKTIGADWSERQEAIKAIAERTTDAMREAQREAAGAGAKPGNAREWLGRTRSKLLAEFDSRHGGFLQSAPGHAKFPHEPLLSLLIAAFRANRDPDAGECSSRRSMRWPGAAFTTISAEAFTAMPSTAPGRCRTSRRCSTPTRSFSASTPRRGG